MEGKTPPATDKADVPSPAPEVRKGLKKRKLALALLMVSVVLVLLTIVPLVSGLAFGVTSHYACVPTNPVVTQAFWTPVLILNSPYGGNATGTTYVPASWLTKGTTESWSTTAVNGSSNGIFELLNWTMHNAQTQIVAGTGMNVKCGGSYLALLQPNTATGIKGVSLSGNLTSTDGKIHSSVSLFASFAEFQDQFSNSGVNTFANSCSGGGFVLGSDSSNIPVEIPFNVGGKIISVNSSVDWNQHYVYSFHSGNWIMDNLTKSQSGTGLAFSSIPC